MTKAMNVLGEMFQMRGYKFLRLDGNTPALERSEGLTKFNAPGSDYFM
jgi:SNF2 family DNA or RNA helicase